MGGPVVGFDFGTTNTLVSVIVGDRAIDILDEEGLPYPSVVKYEGERVVVGREAKRQADGAGLGIHGSIVKSPKVLLGEEVVSVGGVERHPIDVAADVIQHVKAEALRSPRRRDVGELDRAVVTIPVTMNGDRRRALREAYARAEIVVEQFIHEPLAALYGYIRGDPDPSNQVRRLARRHVLVVDWGGGTLDLTLCRISDGRILQLKNSGSTDVGGDEFDRVLRTEIVRKARQDPKVLPEDTPTVPAQQQLLERVEKAKIELSEREKVTGFVEDFFPQSEKHDLVFELTRDEMESATRPLVRKGVDSIKALLDSAYLSPAQVSLVLLVGGMSAMPAIRGEMYEMFGPERVERPPHSATLVSQGAAWVANDRQRLVLAKRIELELARGSRLPLLREGTAMPRDGKVTSERFNLFCADPTDGWAKFPIVTPADLKEHPQAGDLRTALGVISIEVDKTAKRLWERLTLTVEVDDNLVLTALAESSQKHDRREESFYDLEFGIGLPGIERSPSAGDDDTSEQAPGTGLVVRANTATEEDDSLVPGDVYYQYRPREFARDIGKATQEQIEERLYYQPCSGCGRQWGDPECRCARPRARESRPT